MWGTLLVFALVIAIGYLVGNRVFPKPTNPADRILGVVPSVISGAFILYYLTSGDFFARDAQGQSFFSIVVQPPDPTRYVFVIFVIAILAVIAGLIMAARAKKPASPAAKK
jgi:membrane protein DedA with SNARE-associated domain